MSRPGRLGALIALLGMVLVIAACGQTSTPTPAPTATVAPTATAAVAFPLTVTDSNGKKVTIASPPKRIVAFDSAAVEALFAMGEGSRIVGTHQFATYPPETASIAKVGDAFNLNFEKIAELKPDLVYIFYDKPVPDLQKLGTTVLYLKSPATLTEVTDRIRLWGQIVGNPAAAETVVSQFQNGISAVTQKVAGVTDGPRLYHDESTGFWTAGKGSLADQIYTLLKGKNIFGDISGYKQVSAEEIVARDPQVIISVNPDGPDSLKAAPQFKNVSAVKDGRICSIDGSLLSTPGPRLVQGVQQVAKCLYPQLFQ